MRELDQGGCGMDGRNSRSRRLVGKAIWLGGVFLLTLVLTAGRRDTFSSSNHRKALKARQIVDRAAIRNPPCGARVFRSVRYGYRSSRQKIDVFVPRGNPGPRPLIVWVHGGGWAGGSRTSVSHYALSFVCEGWAVASVGYHASWEAPFRAPLLDVQNAIRTLRKRANKFRVDRNRIILWGASAGAHLAALAALTHDWRAVGPNPLKSTTAKVQGAVLWWTPVDFVSMSTDFPGHCKGRRRIQHPQSNESRLLGCVPQRCPITAKSASPLSYVRPDAPPMLLMHGQKDCTVPAKQSERLHNALRAAGSESELVLLDSAGHGDMSWRDRDTLMEVREFMRRVIGEPYKAPQKVGRVSSNHSQKEH